MKLKKLVIELQPSYRENAGKYEAEIEYEGKTGEIKLMLDSKISEALLVCIGGTITEFAHRAGKQLEADIKQSVEEAKRPLTIEHTTE